MTSARSLLLGLSLLLSRPLQAAPPSDMVVFFEPGFPAADTAAPSAKALQALPGASLVDAGHLPGRLARAGLLVLPYGSAFPEPAWAAIHAFLSRGGNLLVLGGKPFARAAFREGKDWRLRPESGRFMRELLIDQYQATPGSRELSFEPNPDRPPALAPFEWTRAFSPLVHLSAKDLYPRDGSAGSLDARLDTLAWGSSGGRKVAAPVIQIDHLQHRFTGGRWILVAAELTDLTKVPVAALAAAAARGSEDFTVRPKLPLYLPGESVQLEVRARGVPAKASVEITVTPQGGGAAVAHFDLRLPVRRPPAFRAPDGKGLFVVEARLRAGEVRTIYRSGFWMRDQAALRSGPRLAVDHDYFQLDGRPLAVVGTTHMASDVQRLFFEQPNVFVWDRDLAALAADGINMLRTGWWSGWDLVADQRRRPTPRALRTLEAYLMTARRHGLPVQFTFFAFLPEVLGGSNPYLDPKALERQRALLGGVAGAFADVPFLAWDLINEPSISRRLWSDRPGGDPQERARWNEWLRRRHPDRAALARAWDRAALPEGELPVPSDAEFDPRAAYSGRGSLAIHDFHLFAQETFAGWVKQLRDAVRAVGSKQLITVGQDEGGYLGRPSPVYFGEGVDFTTNHSWWQNDNLVWDSLVARQPGKPMLIQETGYQRELTLDQAARRDPQGEADLVARKIAMSFVQGAGAIQWLWHTNAFMTAGNEVSIGAVRADGTEKPEAAVVRAFARFAKELGPHLQGPEPPPVAVVTSQAALLSVARDLQVEAQQAAVRALVRDLHQPASLIDEHALGSGRWRLLIVPSAQAFTEAGWRGLLAAVNEGATMLVTGAVERDEYWHRAGRLSALLPDARVEALVSRDAELRLPAARVPLSFAQRAQSWLEAVRFPDGASVKEIEHGKGRILWAALPVELAESAEATRALYAHALARAGVTAPIEFPGVGPAGVLIHATVLRDAVLHVLVSERSDDAVVTYVDRTTRARVSLRLRAGGTALALLRRPDGAVIARHGF
jgi:hypothetical protein